MRYFWTFLYKVHLAVNVCMVTFFCDSGYWPDKAEAVSGGKMKVGRQDNPSVLFCSCSLWFHEPSAKAVMYNVFLRLQIFPSTQQAFQLLELNVCNFILKKKNLQRICNTRILGSFCGSDL